MRRVLSLLCIMLLVLTVTGGCWSRHELNELAIVTGIGIDKIDNDYLLSLQVLNMGQASAESTAGSGGGSGLPVTTHYMKASSIFEGFRRLTTVLPRKLYFAHIRVMVFNEKVAREGLRDTLDLFVRDHEFRPDFYLVVTKEAEARKVMSLMLPIEQSPATSMLKSLEVSEAFWAPSIAVTLDEFVTNLMQEGKEAVLTGLELKGDVEKARSGANLKTVHPSGYPRFSRIGVFKKDKLVGWLNEDESRGFAYITDRVQATVTQVECEGGGRATIELLRSKTTMKASVVDGEPLIKLHITGEGNIGEIACSADFSKPDTLHSFERQAERQIDRLISQVIRKARQQYRSDIFGFGQAVFRNDPEGWKKLKKDWDEHFMRAKVETEMDIKLRRTGKVGDSFTNKIK